jgi:glycosyltransferase involved in cell wall biosynthesis
MRPQKLRVLLDMSMALHGYCGISQDVRLLYKTLAACPDVELTGLIYPAHARTRRHRFCRASAEVSDRIANQSVFLWSIKEGPPAWRYPRPVRILARLRQAASRLATRSARLDRLEGDKLWPAVWRTLFSQTLAAEDIPLVADGKFLLSNVAADTMFWHVLAGRRPVKYDTRGYDFVIVETARPMRVSPGTRQIVRYHDMIPVLQPDTTPLARDIKWHHKAIRQSRSSFFVCNSDPTREHLTSVYPELGEQSTTIPYMISDAYRPQENPGQIRSIIDLRRSGASGAEPRKPLRKLPRYVMSVSTLEPRKNFIGLIQAFNELNARDAVRRAAPNLKLLIVGGLGWKYDETLAAMRAPIERGDLIHLERVTTEELRVLYTHAEALVFPSHAEGFGFPPLEAMQCDVPVIVSDVPEHRWVMGDAALYCNSYDATSIADAVERVVVPESSLALRKELIVRGRECVKRYSIARCTREWLDLLYRLKEGSGAPRAETTARRERGRSERSLMEQAA